MPCPKNCPTASLKPAGKHNSHRDALDHLALVAREACVSEPHRTVTIRKTLLDKLPHPRHYTGSRLKHIPFFFEKRPISLS